MGSVICGGPSLWYAPHPPKEPQCWEPPCKGRVMHYRIRADSYVCRKHHVISAYAHLRTLPESWHAVYESGIAVETGRRYIKYTRAFVEQEMNIEAKFERSYDTPVKRTCTCSVI